MAILRQVADLMLATVLGVVAFLFMAYGLSYKGLNIIAENYTLLLCLTSAVVAVLIVLYYVFYFLKKQSMHRLILCALVCLDIFSAIFYAISAAGIIDKFTSIDALQQYIASFKGTAVFIFILIQFLQVVILPVPGSVTVGVGVVLFGPLKSSLYSLVGILLGSVVAFFIGRVIGYKAVCWIVGKEDLDKWLEKVKGKDYLLLSIMFLLPLFPDDVLCFVAGLSSMTTGYFLVMIVITRVISVFTTSYSLNTIPFTTWWGILIWIALFALIVTAFWLVCKYSDKIDAFLKRRFKIKGRHDEDEGNKGDGKS